MAHAGSTHALVELSSRNTAIGSNVFNPSKRLHRFVRNRVERLFS
jgi:hypothetical protein